MLPKILRTILRYMIILVPGLVFAFALIPLQVNYDFLGKWYNFWISLVDKLFPPINKPNRSDILNSILSFATQGGVWIPYIFISTFVILYFYYFSNKIINLLGLE